MKGKKSYTFKTNSGSKIKVGYNPDPKGDFTPIVSMEQVSVPRKPQEVTQVTPRITDNERKLYRKSREVTAVAETQFTPRKPQEVTQVTPRITDNERKLYRKSLEETPKEVTQVTPRITDNERKLYRKSLEETPKELTQVTPKKERPKKQYVKEEPHTGKTQERSMDKPLKDVVQNTPKKERPKKQYAKEEPRAGNPKEDFVQVTPKKERPKKQYAKEERSVAIPAGNTKRQKETKPNVLDVQVIVHTVGRTKESIFGIEFIYEKDSLVYGSRPSNYTKYNEKYDRIYYGGNMPNIYNEVENIFRERMNAGLREMGKNIVLFSDKKTFEFLGSPQFLEVRTIKGNNSKMKLENNVNINSDKFSIVRPPVGGNADEKGYAECPWKNSIVTYKSVFIYEKPFSNFTRFNFKIFDYEFNSIEHLIMFLRILVLAPLGSVKETHELSCKGGTYITALKNNALAHIKANAHAITREKESTVAEVSDKFLTYALYRKVYAHPGLYTFFLENSEKTFYETVDKDTVWAIRKKLELDRKDDPVYINELEAIAKAEGPSKNVFGKYLTKVARMIADDHARLKSSRKLDDKDKVTLERIFLVRELELGNEFM